MGSGQSALPQTPDNLRAFSVTFHWIDTLRLVHAQPRVYMLIRKAIENNWPKGINGVINNKGAYDVEINGRPFAHGSSGESMLCHILEYLLADGWRLSLRSDLTRQIDFTTWFFEQSSKWKQTAKIAAVSLRGLEDLHLIDASSAFIEAVKKALKIKYPLGIQQSADQGRGEYRLRLNGMPWISENDEGMDARRFILQMIYELQEIGWFLYNTANCKGTADCIFFIRHPNGENDWDVKSEYSMISLNNNDRMRLIDLDEEFIPRIRKCINKYYGKDMIQREGQFHGAYEFKFKGEPWCADAQDVVYSRYLIVKVIEMMREHGWEFYHAVDMTRKLNDKAVMIFRKAKPVKVTHWALAPAEVDKVRVIGAPNGVIDTVRKHLLLYYPNGISSENPNFYGCHEFKLKGMPWYGRQGNDELFMTSCLLFLLKRLDKDGWKAAGSLDVSAKHLRTNDGPDYPIDVHTLFFTQK